ncbi:MAG TPA: phage Gp37/Gp68 family protein [Bacilli bacterium]|nr:phage Gp37/Gp68 family protein [Bacilli bacterium]
MVNTTKIEWTDTTWNPVTGCTKVSPGCVNCYAERMAKRLTAMKNPRYRNGFKVTMHEDLLDQPLKKKKPSMVFVCSMSDLFHEDVTDEFIKAVFETMNKADRHIFQVLTKRPERVSKLQNDLNFTENIWIGASVENDRVAKRVDYVRNLPAAVKFLSCEPLLGSLRDVSFEGIDWIVVGGESGPNARPMNIEWVREIRDACQKEEIKFFFKQWGGWNKKKNGRELDGKIFEEMPKNK